MNEGLSSKDLLEVLLKDYEIQREYVTVYWQMLGAWITLLLSAAGFALYYGVTEGKRLLVGVVPFILLAGMFVVVFWTQENYYANVYMACVEQEIQSLLRLVSPVEPLGWISEVTVQASGVNDYGIILGAALLVFFQLVAYMRLLLLRGKEVDSAPRWWKWAFRADRLAAACIALSVGLAIWDQFRRSEIRDIVLSTKPCCDRGRVP